MEDKKSTTRVWRLAADSTAGRLDSLAVSDEQSFVAEDASPQVARDAIVKDMMRIFDGLMGCTAKRRGVNLDFLHSHKAKPASGTQRKLEQEIYRLIRGLVESNSENTGFALNVLFNNCTYYYNKAAVPVTFSTFLTAMVAYLEGHDCLNVCPEEMVKLKSLLERG